VKKRKKSPNLSIENTPQKMLYNLINSGQIYSNKEQINTFADKQNIHYLIQIFSAIPFQKGCAFLVKFMINNKEYYYYGKEEKNVSK
jgi:hypothetical protein